MTRLVFAAALLFTTLLARADETMPRPLHVEGTKIVNDKGERILLRGVNIASLEWSANGEGHIIQTVKVAVNDWKVNIIRVPLAQDRWFGKAPEQKNDGNAYRAIVKEIVDFCASKNVYVILDLHWSDTGDWGKRIGQHMMPDQNSITFWKSCASIYKNHPGVIFDLYNEPFRVTWEIWLKGGKVTEKAQKNTPEITFEAVGMQTLLDTIRATGAKNMVICGGLDWSYDLSAIVAGKTLKDHNGHGVVYANHAYPFKGDTVEKWVAKMEAASNKLPLIISEFGSEPEGGAGLSGDEWVRKVLEALKSHEWSWTAWDLHPYAKPGLIVDWKYGETAHFGVHVKQALVGPSR